MRFVHVTAIIAALTGVATLMIEPATAQTPPKPRPLADAQAGCEKTYSSPKLCSRIAEIARGRYGNSVTWIQWNAAVGVVHHQIRKGEWSLR